MTKTLRAKQSEAKPLKGSRRLAQEGGDAGVAEALLVRSMLHYPSPPDFHHQPTTRPRCPPQRTEAQPARPQRRPLSIVSAMQSTGMYLSVK